MTRILIKQILFGLNKPAYAKLIWQNLKTYRSWFNRKNLCNLNFLSKKYLCPLTIEFTMLLRNNSILRSCYKSQGTNIFILKNLKNSQRKRRKFLLNRLKREKVSSQSTKCFIRGNKLIQDNIYNADELVKLLDDVRMVSSSLETSTKIRNDNQQYVERKR